MNNLLNVHTKIKGILLKGPSFEDEPNDRNPDLFIFVSNVGLEMNWGNINVFILFFV